MVKGTFWKIFSKISSHFEEESYEICQDLEDFGKFRIFFF